MANSKKKNILFIVYLLVVAFGSSIFADDDPVAQNDIRILDLPPEAGIPAGTLEVAAPWDLTGNAYILVYALSKKFKREEAFVPEELKDRNRGRLGVVLIVDYKTTDVGPYKELMFIPGAFRFKNRSCYTISKIYVSSWLSVLNGRLNWGIPKEMADMVFETNNDRTEEISVFKDGTSIAYFKLRPIRVPFPVNLNIVPDFLKTFGQIYPYFDQTYFYSPEMSGIVQPAALLESHFDSIYFPDLNKGRLLAVFRIKGFNLYFPEAEIVDGMD